MTIWFTSDQHFYHTNIIRLANRPFHNVEEMHETLIMNWQQAVKDDDLVYCLGDFSWQFQKIPQLLERLPGRKVLIVGNHSKCFKEIYGISSGTKYTDFYKHAGFSEIYRSLVIDIAGQLVNLSHFPYRNDDPEPTYDDRYRAMRLVNDGRWLIHGHIHQRRMLQDRMINVSVEVTDYKPVSLETIARIIRNDNDCHSQFDNTSTISLQNLTSINNPLQSGLGEEKPD